MFLLWLCSPNHISKSVTNSPNRNVGMLSKVMYLKHLAQFLAHHDHSVSGNVLPSQADQITGRALLQCTCWEVCDKGPRVQTWEFSQLVGKVFFPQQHLSQRKSPSHHSHAAFHCHLTACTLWALPCQASQFCEVDCPVLFSSPFYSRGRWFRD